MTRNQLTKAMTMMGLTQTALAKALETDERSVRRWMRGESPVPVAVGMLLNLMAETKTTLEGLKR